MVLSYAPDKRNGSNNVQHAAFGLIGVLLCVTVLILRALPKDLSSYVVSYPSAHPSTITAIMAITYCNDVLTHGGISLRPQNAM
jgi:hypothetical protein